MSTMMRPTSANTRHRQAAAHHHDLICQDSSKKLEVVSEDMTTVSGGNDSVKHRNIIDKNHSKQFSESYKDNEVKLKAVIAQTDSKNGHGYVSSGGSTDCNYSQIKSKIRDDEIRLSEDDPELMIVIKMRFCTFLRVTCGIVWSGLAFCCIMLVLNFEEIFLSIYRMPNVQPSLIWITAIQSQCYVWRLCMACHSIPRFAIGYVSWCYYSERRHFIMTSYPALIRVLVHVSWFMFVVENGCLGCASYVHSSENDNLHQNIFLLFIGTSVLSQILTLGLYRVLQPTVNTSPQFHRSYQVKRICFFVSLCIATSLIYSYVHQQSLWNRTSPALTTMCALREYAFIALNVLFLYTAVYDFGDQVWYGLVCNMWRR